jgi:anti-sigma factor RsiW
VSCDPVRVTGYVDGALAPAERVEMEAHLASCANCRTQAETERALRARLLSLPHPEFPPALESTVRARLVYAPRQPRAWRVLLPLAAALVLAFLWVRGAPGLVATQLAWDHGHCFGKAKLPAKVWSSDPAVIERWFADRGTAVPRAPESVAGLTLVGARYCLLMDRRVAHIYYADRERRLSLHVVPGPVRFAWPQRRESMGRTVQLLHSGGLAVGLTSEDENTVDAFTRALSVQMVGVDPPPAR